MPLVDNYPGTDKAINAPSSNFAVITPSDVTDLTVLPKYLIIGATGGALTVHNIAGESVAMTVIAGQRVDIRPRRVLDTGTDATTIIGVY